MSAVVIGVDGLSILAERHPSIPEVFRERLENLRRQSIHFVRRSTALLDATRLAAGRGDLDVSECNLRNIVVSVVTELATPAARSRCSLDVDAAEDAEGRWDAAAIETISFNLISNAIKYGSGAPVEITVDRETDWALLRVADRGPGIRPEERARIFAPFEDLQREDDTPGFGVGLWTARQFALAHGGELSVEGREGGGSIFTARLPRLPAS
jgi:signal transduction histidine kinase